MKNKWLQPTPHMEYIAIKSAIDGHQMNFMYGIITIDYYTSQINCLLEQIDALIPFIEKGSW